jgi:hypothetical protein
LTPIFTPSAATEPAAARQTMAVSTRMRIEDLLHSAA